MPVRRSSKVPLSRAHRFLLRLPAGLHQTLSEAARRAGVSLNEYCVRRLAGVDGRADFDAGPTLAHGRRIVGTSLIGAVLHGSWARGDARATSDVDVLMVVERTVPLSRALYAAWDQGAPTAEGRAIDAHFVHLPIDPLKPSAVWCEAALDGMVIDDRDGSVGRALVDVRRSIAEGRVVRRRVHGQSYWTTAA